MKTKFNGFLTLLLAFVVQITFAQEQTVSGTVVDENNIPLPSATVIVKGTTNGTSTDFDGNYSINANTGDTIQFSFVGYATQEIVVSSNSINVTLQPDNALEEVVVTAVGIKRKPDEITTSTQVVKADELNQAQNPNAVQALAGKVSGLQINTTSTGVNPNTTINLRGTRSISGANSALVVIDDVVSSASLLSALDPTVIESVNVLKGANGAALYGARGMNGVIIVTTKKGAKGEKFTVDVSSTLTIEEIAFLPTMQDRFGKGYAGEIDAFDQGSWGAEYDGSIQPQGTPFPTVSDWRYSRYEFREDNMKPFFNTGLTTQNSVSIAGGRPDTGYVNFTANKVNTKGVIPKDKLRRDFLSLNAGKKINKFTVGASVRYTNQRTNVASAYSGGNVYSNLAQLPGNINIEDFDSGDNDDHWTIFGDSPYWIIDNSRRISRSSVIDLIGNFQYELNDNINFVLRPSVTTSTNYYDDYVNEYTESNNVTGDNRNIRSRYENGLGSGRSLYTDFLTNFDYMLTDDISLKANVGANLTESRSKNLTSFGFDLLVPEVYNLNNVTSIIESDNSEFITRTAGVFANLDLGYKDYLYLNFTARQDWTSVLNAPGKKVRDLGFFYPSAGVSFIPTNAFKNIKGKILHKAKLSASIVKVGNVTAIGANSILDTGVAAGGFPFGTDDAQIGSYVLSATNVSKDIEPEFVTSTEFNANLEFLYIRGPRITLDASASFVKNSNQILGASTSSTTGLVNSIINVGETETKAYEVDLGFTPIKTDNFSWKGNIGFSTYKTTVTKVTDDSNRVVTRGGSPGIYAVEGEEFPLIMGSAYQRDAQGRIIVGTDGTPLVSSGLEILGKVNPDYILNFGTEVKYKGLTLSATADYRTGHDFYSNIYNDLTSQGRSLISAYNGRQPFILPNSTVQGSGTNNTSVLTGGAANDPFAYQQYIQGEFTAVDENFVLDASAFKLREVALSYSLPSKLLKNMFINNLTIGVSGRNLLVILPKENHGYNDPEIGNGIGGYSQTPPTKFYAMNVKLSF